jgi:iron complex transport system substrate-binding protein
MHRRVAVLVTLVALLAASPAVGAATTVESSPAPGGAATQDACSFPVTVTDATGTEVTVEERPEEVVVLGASAAQTMWAIDGADQVVGMPVDGTTAYLEGSTERTDVFQADRFTVDRETVFNLSADLVVASNIIPPDTVETLRANQTVLKLSAASSIEDIYAKTERIGRVTGNCGAAAETNAAMRERVETVASAVESVPAEERPRVLYPMRSGYTPGPSTFVHDVIETAGGENVAEDANVTFPPTGYAKISNEVVIAQDPQWVVLTHDGTPPADPAANVPDAFTLDGTTAATEGQFVAVSANYMSQPGPRIVAPLTKLARTFHPEAYTAANATTTTTEDANATTTETATTADAATATTGESGATTAGSTTDSPGVPGPGVAGAVGALALAGGALARRRGT